MTIRGIGQKLHPIGKILILIGLMLFIGGLSAQFLSPLLLKQFFGLDSEPILQILNGESLGSKEVLGLKFSAFINGLFAFLPAALLFGFLVFGSVRRWFGFGNPPQWSMLVLIAPLAILLPIVVNQITVWWTGMDFSSIFGEAAMQKMIETSDRYEVANLQIASGTSVEALFLNLVVLAVLPALGEELFFRGGILKSLLVWTKKKHLAVWISAALFSLIHFQWLNFPAILILGAYLGYLFLWTGNIWYPILAHFLHNGIMVIGLFIYNRNASEAKLLEEDLNINPLIVLGAALLSAFFLFSLFKKMHERVGQRF